MERILLVEPNYKNKYPPIGLMKLATYHKQKGDIVEFYKGEAPYTQIIKANRVYITSLFTFDYDITLKTIRHYQKYASDNDIYIGGIAASLLTNRFAHDTGLKNILTGLLTDSVVLGYHDNINIDRLPLDYDILDDTPYIYPAGDNYFIHATRGCPRGCAFCAVRILEPHFETTNSVISQVLRVNESYGEKRNLLMMDNNILCSNELTHIVDDIISLGFTAGASYLRPNQFGNMMGKIYRRQECNSPFSKQLEQVIDLIKGFESRIVRYRNPHEEYLERLRSLESANDSLHELNMNYEYYFTLFEKYSSKSKMRRYVDFNQGIDARLINEETISVLSRLPIRPFRLAFDSLDDKEIFLDASALSHEHGVTHFSNYMLYNWMDKPEQLWERLSIAVDFYNSSNDITGFSFPMKYAPIDQTDRSFVGEKWNKKYLRAINVITNVTNGVVAKERDFFEEAFGKNLQEYLEILAMPDEFIRYRKFFKENGVIQYWTSCYQNLTKAERDILLQMLSEMVEDQSVLDRENPLSIRKMLLFYKIKKRQFDNGDYTLATIREMYQDAK